MKRLFVAALLALSTAAFGATTVPVQLLNPTGSTAGQAIVSTGPSSAPAWGSASVPIAHITGLGTGVSSALAATVTGSGGIVLATSPTIATPTIIGVTNGSNAAAGSVGESQSNTTSGTSLTNGVGANATSIVNLPAGDWDISGTATFLPAASTTVSSLAVGVSTVSGSFPPSGVAQQLSLSFPAGVGQQISAPTVRVSISTPTTVYIYAQASFGVSTMTVNGSIRARRVR
jgi:hypothetical protein